MFNSKGFLSKKQPIEDDIFPMNILIEKIVSNDDLTDIISQILNLERKDIFVVEDIQDLRIKIPNNIKVICETINIEGDFRTSLSLYPKSKIAQHIIQQFCNENQVAKKICDILKCNCLTKKESLSDEDCYWLIQHNSDELRYLYLDSQKLDEGIYVIEKN
jgi:hypothetical protein